MHPILRDPDLPTMLSMPPKDESASEHASNSKRSRLTPYIVDATKDESASEHVSNSMRSRLTRYVVDATER